MTEPASTIVWDFPTRLFHWTLVVLILLQYLSGEFGLIPMAWHYWLGYATLALVVFRVLWGFLGSTTSRFASFVRGPGAVLRYVRTIAAGRDVRAVGHNPLGGWSVLLMLASVIVQSVSGLFATDDLTETGPLADRVSDATVEWMTRAHHLNRWLLALLIALHVVAVLMHWVIRRDNLVAAMVHGRGRAGTDDRVRIAPAWRAILLFAISAIAVALVVTLGAGA
ncbi:MAG TPA: cytochrome b/b6 domain-containing protein [Rhodanobacteraceae bacterium]|nr:cytochrome b/b6 domain-containing protein [Rhodanobacteraceae bacterium]